MKIERLDNVLWKVIFKNLTPETEAFIRSEFEQAELRAGIVQALAERERVIGIIEQYNGHSSHNPYDKCLDEVLKEIQKV